MAIDIHAHCFPTEYLDLLGRHGDPSVRFARGMGAGDSDDELQQRFDLMDRAGITMQVLSITPQLPVFEDESDAVEAVRLVNNIYADLVRRFPERFTAFAALPLPHVEASLEEMTRALDDLGMVGVCITNTIGNQSLVDPAFEPVFQEMDRRGTTLFVHPAGKSAFSSLIAESGLTWPIGAPIEDTIAATQLIARNFPLRYRDLHVILCHLGGALPLLLRRLDHQLHETSDADAELPSMQARRMWYDTVSHNDPAALRCACDALGSSQLLLGTDFPYLTGDWFTGAVSYIRDFGFEDGADQRILVDNARQLLGIVTSD